MDELFCNTCGDAVPSYDSEGNGPCCHNLPQPWHRGRDGLYNNPTEPGAYYEERDHSEEEEEEDCRHECNHYCGECEAVVNE